MDDFKDPLEHERLLLEEMHQRFTMLKTFIGKDSPMQERLQKKEAWDPELQKIVDENFTFDDTRVKAQYV